MTCATDASWMALLGAAAGARGMTPYRPPAREDTVDLLLDANEGGPPGERVLQALRDVGPEILRRYPSADPLRAAIALRFGLGVQRVIVTNGADEAIDRVCRATLQRGRIALLHTPTFEMIERSARLAGGAVRRVRWREGPFPIQSFLDSINRATALVALVSPNNPTGAVIDPRDLLAVAREAARVGAVAMIDLAYVEFARVDPTALLLEEPNVVIVRTFSKAMGLAGLRLGYAMTSTDLAALLNAAGGPYAVSSVAVALGLIAWNTWEDRSAYLARVGAERAVLSRVLRELGAEVLPSEANFVTARVADAPEARAELSRRGIAVRTFPSSVDLSADLRITLPGDEASFERLIEALKRRPELIGPVPRSAPEPAESRAREVLP